MVALLAGDLDMRVAKLAHGRKGELPVADLGLLQAHDIGAVALDELPEQRQPEADGVDVPGRDLQQHGLTPTEGGKADVTCGN